MIIADVVGTLALGIALWSLIAWLIPPHTVPQWGVGPPRAIEVPRRAPEELLAQAHYVVALGVVLALTLAAGALALVGLWALFVPGARKLGRASPEFRTASTLIWIGYFWGVLVFVIALFAGLGCVVYLALIQSPAVLLAVVGVGVGVLVGAALVLIGLTGSIALVYKLYKLERVSLYLAAAILLIASLVLSFAGLVPNIGTFISIASSVMGFVALILLYAALGTSIERVASSTATAPSAGPTGTLSWARNDRGQSSDQRCVRGL